jgi:ABC-type sugar transport system ATPase subunit
LKPVSRIVFENVTKSYIGPRGQRVQAVRSLNLDVADGEFIAVLGPSGSGKTTMLRLMAGLEKPDTGTITIDGRAANDIEPQDRDAAMVFQHPALLPHLTAFDNMALGLKLRGFQGKEIEKRVRATAESFGLGDLLDRLPKDLSGGERQRVSIGRALVREPKMFLFDEPLAHLDGPLCAQTRAEIVKLHRRLGTTMLYVTHDHAEAKTLARRIVILNSGEIQQVDEPQGIAARPANEFVARFFKPTGAPA